MRVLASNDFGPAGFRWITLKRVTCEWSRRSRAERAGGARSSACGQRHEAAICANPARQHTVKLLPEHKSVWLRTQGRTRMGCCASGRCALWAGEQQGRGAAPGDSKRPVQVEGLVMCHPPKNCRWQTARRGGGWWTGWPSSRGWAGAALFAARCSSVHFNLLELWPNAVGSLNCYFVCMCTSLGLAFAAWILQVPCLPAPSWLCGDHSHGNSTSEHTANGAGAAGRAGAAHHRHQPVPAAPGQSLPGGAAPCVQR